MAFTVAVTAKGVFEPPREPSAGWVPERTAKPYRWAHLTVTTDITSYATGGIACDILGALTGWTHIASANAQMFTNNSVDTQPLFHAPNGAGDKKVIFIIVSTGAEVAAAQASTVSSFEVFVVGY